MNTSIKIMKKAQAGPEKKPPRKAAARTLPQGGAAAH
jgi:hypothetical protein